MAEITLDDLKQELKNLNIQVGNVHESSCRLDSKLDNSLVSAVVYPIQFIEQHAPKLAQLIRQSVIDVNGASNIDGDSVESPLSVSVVFKGDYAETFAIGNSENGSALTIGYNAFCNRSDVADVKSVLDHEFGHLIPDSPADKKSAELRSDRYANAMDRIRSLLYEISHQAWQYDFDSTNKTHPNNRERIRALLEEAFGNDVFKMSGYFSSHDFHFHPKMENNSPVTEDGRIIKNWDGIESAMQAPINAIMKKLQAMMNDRSLTHDEITQFMHDVDLRMNAFKADAENQVMYAQESNAGNALALSDVQRKVAQYVLDNIREYQFLSSAENSQTM